MSLQSVEMRRPKLAIRLEPVIELFKWFWTNAVQAALSIRANVDESRVSQNPEMFGDIGLTQVEALD